MSFQGIDISTYSIRNGIPQSGATFNGNPVAAFIPASPLNVVQISRYAAANFVLQGQTLVQRLMAALAAAGMTVQGVDPSMQPALVAGIAAGLQPDWTIQPGANNPPLPGDFESWILYGTVKAATDLTGELSTGPVTIPAGTPISVEQCVSALVGRMQVSPAIDPEDDGASPLGLSAGLAWRLQPVYGVPSAQQPQAPVIGWSAVAKLVSPA